MPGGGIQPRYSGLRVQGTANSPSSTASQSMLGERFKGVKRLGARFNRFCRVYLKRFVGPPIVQMIELLYSRRPLWRKRRYARQ